MCNGDFTTAIRITVLFSDAEFLDASETQNGLYYASAFAAEATWSGPLGESGDPQKPQEMFNRYGPLVTREWEVRPLTSDVKIVDIYQEYLPLLTNIWPLQAAHPEGTQLYATSTSRPMKDFNA